MRVPRKSNKIYHFLFAGIDSGKFRPGERIPTELELARLFDVSRPTATAAIRRLVAEHLLQRGRKAGTVVIGLPSRRTLTFGAVLLGLARQDQEQTIFAGLGSELAHRASMEHAMMLLQDPQWDGHTNAAGLQLRYQEIARRLIQQKVAGVFLMPLEISPADNISPTAALVEEFAAARIPVVLIDGDIVRYPARSHLDLVGIDNFGAGFHLTQHFIRLGCRRIDFFGSTFRHPTQEARIAGYMAAFEAHGLRPDDSAVHHLDLWNNTLVLEKLRQRKPEAVLVVSDSRAAPIMRCALEDGWAIPQQLRLGSFDDLPMAAYLQVPLTTMRQPAAGLGAAAYRLMRQRLEEPGLPATHVQLSAELIRRASSGESITAKAGSRK